MRSAESLRRTKTPEHRRKLSEAGVATQKAKRVRLAEAAPLHPKEKQALRVQAYANVVEDLSQLRELAKMRTFSAAKRAQFLGRYEFTLLERLLTWAEMIAP